MAHDLPEAYLTRNARRVRTQGVSGHAATVAEAQRLREGLRAGTITPAEAERHLLRSSTGTIRPIDPIDPFSAAPRASRSGSASGQRGTGAKRGPNLAEKAVREALEAAGWDVHRGGLIDFIAQRPGRLAFIEVKNRETRDRLSLQQRNVLADLRHRGVEEYVLDIRPSTGEMVVWTVPNVPPVPFIQVFGHGRRV